MPEVNMRKLFYLILVLIFAASCGNRRSEVPFTKENAMQKFLEMSPEQGASFYAKNRLAYSFLDSFYRDSIFPAVTNCSYNELKNINTALKNTPLTGIAEVYFDEARKMYLKDIHAEIINNVHLQKQVFEKEVMPLMEIELNSMVTDDMENVIDKYAGGFLNYRKLEFFFGKDGKDFKELWKKYVHVQSYSERMNKYVEAYLDSICKFQEDYLYSVTGRKINKKLRIDIPYIPINISSDILGQVNEFTKGEKMAMTTELIKDYAAPVVIGALTGGVGSVIYEIGNTSYDVYDLYQEIENEEVEPEEQLLSVCVEEINDEIKKQYFQAVQHAVMNRIENSNQVLYNLILFAL